MIMVLIAIAVAIIILFLTFYFLKSSKELPTNLRDILYEMKFQFSGTIEIMLDIHNRRKNRVELKSKPNRLAIITGGNRGLGLRVVEKLLRCDISVVIACRDPKKGQVDVEAYLKENGVTGNVSFEKLDTAVMSSVHEFAKLMQEKYPKINYLINNAGIMCAPFKLTKDGFESHMAVNYLGHFLLTHLLLPQLKAGGSENENSRIINVSSCVNKIGEIEYNDFHGKNAYYPARAYSNSKLAQVLFTVHLNSLLREQNCHVQVNAVHPGVVNTDLFEHSSTTSIPWFKDLTFRTPEKGSRSIVYAVISDQLEGIGGNYIETCRIARPNPLVKNKEECKKFFEFTCKMLDIKEFGKH